MALFDENSFARALFQSYYLAVHPKLQNGLCDSLLHVLQNLASHRQPRSSNLIYVFLCLLSSNRGVVGDNLRRKLSSYILQKSKTFANETLLAFIQAYPEVISSLRENTGFHKEHTLPVIEVFGANSSKKLLWIDNLVNYLEAAEFGVHEAGNSGIKRDASGKRLTKRSVARINGILSAASSLLAGEKYQSKADKEFRQAVIVSSLADSILEENDNDAINLTVVSCFQLCSVLLCRNSEKADRSMFEV